MTFEMSPELRARMARGENRATTTMQLSGALPPSTVSTVMSGTPMPLYLRYANEVVFDGAVAYWRLGESAGPTAFDRTANAHHGTFTGSVVFGVEGALVPNIPAEANTAVSLGGGYFTVPHHPSLSPVATNDFSVELWFHCVQDSGFPASIVDKSDVGAFPYRLRLVAGKAVEAARSDGTNTPTLTSAYLGYGTWHYILFTKIGPTLSLTVDEATISTADTTTGTTATTVPLVIGSPELAATLDEVAIYNVGLTAQLAARHRTTAKGLPV